jgi:predicted phosphohydrolase
MERHGIKRCYYGHIHGVGHRYAIEGTVRGISFTMISADYLGFDPLLVEK